MAISQYALAKAIGVPPRRINEIVKGWRGITVDKALRLSVFFGTDAQSWGNLQTHYDTEHARVAMADVLGRIVRRELADDHHETPNARAKLAPTAWRQWQIVPKTGG